MSDVTTPSAPVSAHDAATAAFADSSSAAPETSTSPESSTAPATVAPVTTETPTVPANTGSEEASVSKDPPQWRWQDILANTRKKVAEETEARLKSEFGWATSIPTDQRAHVPTALQLIQALNTDPKGTIEALKRYAGLEDGGTTGGGSKRPEPDVDAGNGTYLYSSQQLEKLREWDRQQILQEVNQRLAPVEQDRQQRVMEQQRQTLVNNVRQTLDRMRERPHFKEHESAIRELMLSDETLSIQDAYAQVLLERVLPSMQKHSESQVLAQLQTRAVSATVNPSAASPSAPGSLIGNARAAAEAAFRDA